VVAAALTVVASDIAHAVPFTDEVHQLGLAGLGWLVGILLMGVAVLSPPGRSPAQRPHPAADAVGWSSARMHLLLLAASAPLVLTILEPPVWGREDTLVAATASLTMFLVIIVRVNIAEPTHRRLLHERASLVDTARRQALTDPLTGLPSRAGFTDWLVTTLAADPAPLALLLVDLDDFKAVNDSLGDPTGDDILRIMGRRVVATIGDGGFVARHGGDEFAVALPRQASIDDVEAMAGRILTAVGDPLAVADRIVTVTASAGFAISGIGPGTRRAGDLSRDAELALFEAKKAGKHRWTRLDPVASASALQRLSLESELARAVSRREFELLFQPIVSLTADRIDSMEALIRWHHPTLGLLPPSDFLAAAERSVHMPLIGQWVLEEACRTAAAWRRLGLDDIGVSVNVSPVQLSDPTFVDFVKAVLEGTGLPTHLLTLEVLEAALGTDPATAERLAILGALGVGLAIDDFGTGYSCLARVAELPITELKLDRSLMIALDDSKVLHAVVHLGQELKLRLVAEGIESAAQLEHVRRLGCGAAQGYFISRPLPADEILPFARFWCMPHKSPRRSSKKAVGTLLDLSPGQV
jgi:diguanylate cyclase (GGDEF)-like protein